MRFTQLRFERCTFLFAALALGDVTGDSQQGVDAAGGVAHRCGVRFEPAPCAFQANHLELERACFAVHHPMMQCDEGRAGLRHDVVEQRLPLHRLQRVGLEHDQARSIHFQQVSGAINHLDALRFGIDERAQTALAVVQGLARAVLLGDVGEHQDHAGDGALPVADRRGAIGDLIFDAIARKQRCVVREAHDLAPLEHPAHRILRRQACKRIENAKHLGERATGCACQRPAGEPLGNRVHAGDSPVRIGGDHRVADRLQRDGKVLLAGAQRRLAAVPCIQHAVEHLRYSPDLGRSGHARAGGAVAGGNALGHRSQAGDRPHSRAADAPGQPQCQQQHTQADAERTPTGVTVVGIGLGLGDPGHHSPLDSRNGHECVQALYAIRALGGNESFPQIAGGCVCLRRRRGADERGRVRRTKQDHALAVGDGHCGVRRHRSEHLFAQLEQINRQREQADHGARFVAYRMGQHRHPAADLAAAKRIARRELSVAQPLLEPWKLSRVQLPYRILDVGTNDVALQVAQSESGELRMQGDVIGDDWIAVARIHRLDQGSCGQPRQGCLGLAQLALDRGGGTGSQNAHSCVGVFAGALGIGDQKPSQQPGHRQHDRQCQQEQAGADGSEEVCESH